MCNATTCTPLKHSRTHIHTSAHCPLRGKDKLKKEIKCLRDKSQQNTYKLKLGLVSYTMHLWPTARIFILPHTRTHAHIVVTLANFYHRIIYFPGGAVQAQAYSALAFQIAARGWLVVIPTAQLRVALLSTSAGSDIIARYLR